MRRYERSDPRNWLAMVGCAAATALLASCATRISGLEADSSPEELAKVLAPCDHEVDAVANAVEFLAATHQWWQVRSVISMTPASRDGEVQSNPATFEVSDGRSTRKLETRIHSSFLPGIRWALSAELPVWLAMADPEMYEGDIVAAVITFNARGEAFFPGECQDVILRAPLAAEYGKDVNDVLSDAVGLRGDDLRAVLRLSGVGAAAEYGAHPGGPREVFLNPQESDPRILEGLDLVSFDVSVTTDLGGEFTLCTRIERGWNDCIPLDAQAVKGDWLSAYVDGSSRLEFWVLDEHANVVEPVLRVGEVSIPDGQRDQAPFRVHVDLTEVDFSSTRPAVGLSAAKVALEVADG